MGSNNEHIVMLPFMAIGHLIPFLALARRIQRVTSFTITIANTPQNIKYLVQSTTGSIDEPNLHFAELPFSTPADSGLPSNTENCENLPLGSIGKFCEATTSLETPFRDLLKDITAREGNPPVCVISDFIFGWANHVATSVGSVNFCFSTCGAYGSLAYFSMWMNLPHRKVDSDEFQIPGFPDRVRFHITQLHQFIRNADGTDMWSKFMQPQIELSLQSAGLLCNTVEEIEPLGLDSLRKYIKIPVWSIGPLLPPEMLNISSEKPSSLTSQRVGKEQGISTERCVRWLDLKRPCSVLYVCFGSQNSISPDQMMELATGLEKSGRPFIWVIRPPIGFDRKAEFRSEWLPKGFEERISSSTKQGLLVRNWAPQLEILSHGSTGAFLSHCGWNSVMESLSQGVAMIGWPLAAEQAYNSKMLVEEMGVSVELARGLQSKISWEEVKNVVEIVMDENGKGGEMRKKAMEIGKLIKDSVNREKGSSVKALDDLITMLKSIRF